MSVPHELVDPPAPFYTKGRLNSGEWFRPVALAALTAVSIGLCVLLAIPFLPALKWGVALAVIAAPVNGWLTRRWNRPTVAALLSTVLVAAMILGAGAFVSYHLAREAGNAAAQANRGEGTVRESLVHAPGLDRVVEWMDRVGLDIDREARKLVAANTGDVAGLAQGRSGPSFNS